MLAAKSFLLRAGGPSTFQLAKHATVFGAAAPELYRVVTPVHDRRTMLAIPPRRNMSTASTHFKESSHAHPLNITKRPKVEWALPHPVYTEEELTSVEVNHRAPKTLGDRNALRTVRLARWMYDSVTGYREGNLTPVKILNRMIFLESIAGVPGMVGGMARHLRSLRQMKNDQGWIYTLLEEAENERMHLITFMKLRDPGIVFRSMVLLGQGVAFNAYFIFYMLFPKSCHKFVGYLEEEAVITYSKVLKEIEKDNGVLAHWRTERAPEVARGYWNLAEDATMHDVVLAVRADEAIHRDVNHTFADLDPAQDSCPL